MNNSNTLIKFLIFSSIALILTGCASSNTKKLMTRDLTSLKNPGLSFPYKYGEQVDYFFCFGLYPWNETNTETHGGINIFPIYSPGPKPKMYPIVAGTDMTLARFVSVPEKDPQSFMQIWEINHYWYVVYNYEPHNDKASALQKENLIFEEGTIVKRGDDIGNLVVQEGFEKLPSIHYALLYKSPEDTFEKLLNDSDSITVSDGNNLLGINPWSPKNLGIPSTFFCPFVFSDSKAKRLFKSRRAYNASGQSCFSVCAYGSSEGDCGRGGILDKIEKE